jgi:hypothetical protein
MASFPCSVFTLDAQQQPRRRGAMRNVSTFDLSKSDVMLIFTSYRTNRRCGRRSSYERKLVFKDNSFFIDVKLEKQVNTRNLPVYLVEQTFYAFNSCDAITSESILLYFSINRFSTIQNHDQIYFIITCYQILLCLGGSLIAAETQQTSEKSTKSKGTEQTQTKQSASTFRFRLIDKISGK